MIYHFCGSITQGKARGYWKKRRGDIRVGHQLKISGASTEDLGLYKAEGNDSGGK
jgi:hypothetical protein